ncbi:glycoside hydrolase family 5 protein [Pseudocolwellia sp. HL-MZ7]|uniref:glycoside hydrolase family 5 protein n=1 Tax=Pseudocolwellia sp. HL-MZ7 TaxID=3400627 RepID=UPI003CE9894C
MCGSLLLGQKKKYNNYLADPKSGKIFSNNSRFIALTAVIDYALNKKDMFVVINAHHEKKLKENADAALLANLWEDISQTFKNRNARLLYEILNEPHLKDSSAMKPSDLRKMTQMAYNNIRKNDVNRLVVIGGNQWFSADEMAKTWPDIKQVGSGTDPFIMATFHHYKPWAFHGNGEGDFMDKWTEQDLTKSMEIMEEWSKNIGHGMPVYIGEWGTAWQNELAIMDCNNIRLWYSKFDAEYASSKGMPTAVWDDGGWFKVFDHDTNAFDNNLIDCIDGECKWSSEIRFNSACK